MAATTLRRRRESFRGQGPSPTPCDRARSPDMADAPAVVGSTLNCIQPVLSSMSLSDENAPDGPLSSSHLSSTVTSSMNDPGAHIPIPALPESLVSSSVPPTHVSPVGAPVHLGDENAPAGPLSSSQLTFDVLSSMSDVPPASAPELLAAVAPSMTDPDVRSAPSASRVPSPVPSVHDQPTDDPPHCSASPASVPPPGGASTPASATELLASTTSDVPSPGSSVARPHPERPPGRPWPAVLAGSAGPAVAAAPPRDACHSSILTSSNNAHPEHTTVHDVPPPSSPTPLHAPASVQSPLAVVRLANQPGGTTAAAPPAPGLPPTAGAPSPSDALPAASRTSDCEPGRDVSDVVARTSPVLQQPVPQSSSRRLHGGDDHACPLHLSRSATSPR